MQRKEVGELLTSQELTCSAVKILDSKKANDIMALKVRDLTIVADYFVIASGSSNTQVKTLADELEFQLSEQGVKPLRTEGYQGGNWIIVDYGDVVVHIFHQETREFYSLERLWADAEAISLDEILQ